MSKHELAERASACLAGAAVGDALGGATEGWESAEIHAHFDGWVEGVVESIRRTLKVEKAFSPFHKGDGHVTDDTLMTRVLVDAYASKRDHLDAYDVERLVVPAIVDQSTWIPELGREDLLYHRLFLAEKWLVLKLRYGHADPRDAGVGNIVNCGAAMYIAPVGIANVGDPDGAYVEALDLTGAHQSSYGREAAGVLAAAVAEAMRPGATVDSVVATSLRLAKDGTRNAIEAVVDRAATLDGWRDGGLAALRSAFAPFDSVGEPYAQPAQNARIPSRLHSIEEVPIALGLLVATAGDYAETMLGGVNYGRDSDSIASMGGALAGALGSPVSRDWIDEIGAASRLDLEEPGLVMAEVAQEIAARDAARLERRTSAIAELHHGARLRVTWIQPEDLVGHELRQAREEGKDVDAIEARWLEAGGRPAPNRGASQEPVSQELVSLATMLLDEPDEVPSPLADIEPGTFEEILAAADPAPACDVDPQRIAGAWLGRAVGCVLGKPVESISRQGIRAIAEGTHNWPVAGWFTANGLDPEVTERYPWNRASRPTSLAENIDGIPEDDDLNFTMLGLALLERCGTGFGALDVAKIWLDYMPPGRIFTAERVAMRNLLDAHLPPRTATRHNPFREWIGARLRVDVYGWAAGGDPVSAARMAWEDARVSHTANGVYAAMFMAAAHAASLGADSSAECADIGLSVVPAGSRLAEALRTARDLTGEWESIVDELYARYGHYHWVHAINNTVLVAAALYHLDGFSAGICGVVQGGWDTDTNGAAVGSILGALGPIEGRWSAPLRGTFSSSLPSFDAITLEELTRRTLAVA